MMVEWDVKEEWQVVQMNAHLLLAKNVDDISKFA